MDNIPDDKKLITKEMSEIIHNRIFNFGGSKAMGDVYSHMLKNEPYCAQDIDSLIDSYSKTTVLTIVAQIMRSPVLDDKLVSVISEPVNKMFQNAFGAGIIYAKARMEQDFANSIKLTPKEDLDVALDESLIAKDGVFLVSEDNPSEEDNDNDGDIPVK